MKRLGVGLLILLGLVMISMSSQGKELHTPQANQEVEVKAAERTHPKDSLTYINKELKAPQFPVVSATRSVLKHPPLGASPQGWVERLK